MKCSKCGTENEEGFKFCGNCGQPLFTPPIVPTVSSEPASNWNAQSVQRATEQRKKKNYVYFFSAPGIPMWLFLILLICAACMTFSFIISLPDKRITTSETGPQPTRGTITINADWDCYTDYGYTKMAGSISNGTGRTVRYVKMRGTALDSRGNTINTNWGYVDSDRIAPGASSTFKLYISDPNKEMVRCAIRVEDWREE